MTQREKIMKAVQFAHMVKSKANGMLSTCKDYDETWAITSAKDLIEASDKLIKMLTK